MTPDSHRPKTRIVILGGGFGGVYTARHLEKLCKGRRDVEIVLVSHNNFLLMTPLLFEVCSGTLDMRDCAFPIRAFLRTTRIAEATVRGIDLERRVIHLTGGSETGELAYDQLVLALGAMTNRRMIPGSEHAFTFKTLADALLLRNRIIECFERAAVEADPQRKRKVLTFVIVGGGLVGVELFGELTAFVDEILSLYKRVSRDEVRFILLQGGDRIMPEMNPTLADYATRVLSQRRGVEIRTQAQVRPSSLAKSICRRNRSRRRRSYLPRESYPTRSSPPCRWRWTGAAISSSTGRCVAKNTQKSGQSAIARRSRRPTANPIPIWPNMHCGKPRSWLAILLPFWKAGRRSHSSTKIWE